ncbi:MAG TPA: hypothetical protein VMV77_12660 [Bacteroidales bacterium]|nr:hypothetical protein [Bacteroidales bacterium]
MDRKVARNPLLHITSESFVRVVDAFVDAIDLKSFGFAHVECEEEGHPPYWTISHYQLCL